MIDDDIIPYCIWHYIDLNTNTILGYIGGPQKHKKENGNIEFDCAENKGDGWVLAGTFYGVSPSFRPIPVGMKIFCAKRAKEFPYNTKDMYLMYDPYNIKENCVYFTTYIQQVPNTVPLYFYASGNNIFPSFDPFPPSIGWIETRISPIFVMINKNRKFKCVNGRCLPWIDSIPSMYDSDPHDDLFTLENCVIYCNELVVSKNEGRPFNILEMIASENIKKKYSYTHIWIIFLSFLTFVILIVIIFKRLQTNSITTNYI